MTPIRLYVDEDAMEGAVVTGLRDAGFDVLTAGEAGNVSVPDEQHLAFAVAEDRAVYSLNAGHFARLHRDYLNEGRAHAGIIVIPRQRHDVRTKIRRILAVLRTTDADDFRNQITYL